MEINVWTVAAIVLGIAATFVGVWLVLVKTKLAQVVGLLHAAAEYGNEILKASEDNTYSEEEKAAVKLKWLALVEAYKLLFNKKPVEPVV